MSDNYHHHAITSSTTSTMHYHVRRCCWFLMVLFLSLHHTLHAKQGLHEVTENCRVYCLKCTNSSSHKTLPALVNTKLEVSLQVTSTGELPYATIVVPDSEPSTFVLVNKDNIILHVGGKPTNFTLTTPRPAYSWITLVLARPDRDALAVYTPDNRVRVLFGNTFLGRSAFVSSNKKTHVVFNCFSGCLVRTSSSSLLGNDGSEGIELTAPFTLYLKPKLSPSPASFKPSISPMLTLTKDSGVNMTVSASDWTPDRWYNVKFWVGNEEEFHTKVHEKLVLVTVPNGRYRLTTLQGFDWTLHCQPQEITNPSAGQNSRKTKAREFPSTQAPEENSEGKGKEEGEAKSTSGERTRQRTGRGGAGAGEVVAWVLAGLALFVVMILALLLCTKTTEPNQAQNLQEYPASVGVLSSWNREPEECSEPGSSNQVNFIPSILPDGPKSDSLTRTKSM